MKANRATKHALELYKHHIFSAFKKYLTNRLDPVLNVVVKEKRQLFFINTSFFCEGKGDLY